ncbi:phosphate ABC transporter substrate-binding protein PstS family protein [Eupransor demetentiae]|uniref:Phosphate-binding protein n=1 Tax=Eupransor demetentiae TaxID=3109584 RepID=A0ABP0EPX6_9LACO|nr:ABC-type phosphate transport system [Lactobacillaceae bacterium LMG 33000]
MKKSRRGSTTLMVICLAIIALLSLAYVNRDKSSSGTSITAVGSTALQPLVEAAGEEYAKANPGIFVNVQGGGTGTGLSQVAQGAVNLGNSDMFAEEKKGINSKDLVDHQVAVVGITPIINPQVGVKDLTLTQLSDIFTGKIKNWREVGGPDQEIVVINRASGSGTRAAFEKWAMDGKQSVEAQEQDSSGMVRSIVSTTPGAISYVAFAYQDKTVSTPKIDGVTPNDENVKNGKYKIWSYEHIYTLGKPQADVQKFLDYLNSKHIQGTLVKKLGYIPINDMQIKRSLSGKISAN